jgi:cell division topological specificity factor
MDLFGFLSRKTPSKNIAKDRLKLVLVHDRANTSTKLLEMLKNDIIKVIQSYMEVDEQELDIQITQGDSGSSNGGKVPMLFAEIPIKSMRKHPESVPK